MNKNAIGKIWMACLIVIIALLIGGIFYYTQRAVAPEVPPSGEEAINQASTAINLDPPPTAPSVPSLAAPSSPTQNIGLNPQSGPVGTSVTIHGSGFGPDNLIEMGGLTNASMKEVASQGGTTLVFVVPENLGPNCNPGEACPQFLVLATPRAYPITVITDGATENIGTFTVTAK